MGSGLFSLYGFLIGALPVGFMNLGIAIINIYYLLKIYSSKEYFKLLPIESDSQYFNYFLDFYKKELEEYGNMSQFNINTSDVGFYILRNMVPAGIFIGSKHTESTLRIDLDFVIPEYRDFKIGTYIFEHKKEYFLDKGYSTFISFSSNDIHIQYLKKMGFKETIENGNKFFKKSLIE
jgi:GNAT superfamily N-acetyltransferase